MPQRRGTWKMAYCLELKHRKQLQTASKLADSDRGNIKKKHCSLTRAGKAAEKEKWQPRNHSCRRLFRRLLVVRRWRWGRINSWDMQCVWSWNTVAFSPCWSSTQSDWVFLFLLSFSEFVFSLHCWVSLFLSAFRLAVHSVCIRLALLLWLTCFLVLTLLSCSVALSLLPASLSLWHSQWGKCLKGWLLPLSCCSSAPLPFRWSRLRQKIS